MASLRRGAQQAHDPAGLTSQRAAEACWTAACLVPRYGGEGKVGLDCEHALVEQTHACSSTHALHADSLDDGSRQGGCAVMSQQPIQATDDNAYCNTVPSRVAKNAVVIHFW